VEGSLDDFDRDFMREFSHDFRPRERWLRDNHITDWPEACVPVLKLLHCRMNNCRIALTLGWPKNEVAAWRCYVASRAYEGFVLLDTEITDIPAVQWVVFHEKCCLGEAIWELLYEDYYPHAARRGLLQPQEYLARIFVRRSRFHPDWLVRCEGTIPPSVRRLRRVVFRHGC
jgi:hypothetical protein